MDSKTAVVQQAPSMAPMITGFTPPTGTVGMTVTINGQNLVGSTPVRSVSVSFGGAQATNLPQVSDTSIMAVVPLEAHTGPLTVGNNHGSGSSEAPFVVKPTITSFSPQRGRPDVTTVVITGTGFLNGPTVVEFSGRDAPVAAPITRLSATEIGVTVPRGAIDGPITVITAGLGSRATSVTSFDVLPEPPRIRNQNGFSPTSGAPGTLVTIVAAPGTTFQEIDRVTFKAAIRRVRAVFGVEGSTKQTLTATVPQGAVTGTIRVQNASGRDLTSMPFIVLGAPTSPLPGTEEEE